MCHFVFASAGFFVKPCTIRAFSVFFSFFLIGAYPAIVNLATIIVVKHLQDFFLYVKCIFLFCSGAFFSLTLYITLWQHSCCFSLGSLCRTLFFLQLQLFYGLLSSSVSSYTFTISAQLRFSMFWFFFSCCKLTQETKNRLPILVNTTCWRNFFYNFSLLWTG
jgi:hypothetical protein